MHEKYVRLNNELESKSKTLVSTSERLQHWIDHGKDKPIDTKDIPFFGLSAWPPDPETGLFKLPTSEMSLYELRLRAQQKSGKKKKWKK